MERCIDGRRWKHQPQDDDPWLEVDVGECEECRGKGCDLKNNNEKETDNALNDRL